MDTDITESLLVVRLNCGEPVSVTTSNPDVKNMPVVFVESSDLAEDYDDPYMLNDDEIVIKSGKTRYEDMEDTQVELEDAGLI